MRPIIIGTAGHIDHGKTALIRALTGRETDRLAQRDHDRSGIYLDGSGKWDARRGHRCPRT